MKLTIKNLARIIFMANGITHEAAEAIRIITTGFADRYLDDNNPDRFKLVMPDIPLGGVVISIMYSEEDDFEASHCLNYTVAWKRRGYKAYLAGPTVSETEQHPLHCMVNNIDNQLTDFGFSRIGPRKNNSLKWVGYNNKRHDYYIEEVDEEKETEQAT